MILTQDGQPFAGGNGYGALIGLDFTAEDFDKGGLACPVGADYPIAVALGEADIHLIEQHPLPVGQRDILDGYHNLKWAQSYAFSGQHVSGFLKLKPDDADRLNAGNQPLK